MGCVSTNSNRMNKVWSMEFHLFTFSLRYQLSTMELLKLAADKFWSKMVFIFRPFISFSRASCVIISDADRFGDYKARWRFLFVYSLRFHKRLRYQVLNRNWQKSFETRITLTLQKYRTMLFVWRFLFVRLSLFLGRGTLSVSKIESLNFLWWAKPLFAVYRLLNGAFSRAITLSVDRW